MDATAALTEGALRSLRGSFVGLATVVLGLSAHVGAGGELPSPAVASALLVMASFSGVLLSRRRWTARPLIAMFLLCQSAVHVTAMVEHPAAAMNDAAMVVSHLVAAVVLVATVLWGEAALVAVVDHCLLRAARVRRTVAPTASSVGFADPAAAVVRRIVIEKRGRAPPHRAALS